MPGPLHYDDLPMNWVGDWAGRRAALTPQREALHDPATEQRFTYAQMNDRAQRLSTYLVDTLGLAKGDTVCFIMRNRLEAVDLYLACGKAGIILAPLSFRLRKRELDDLLARIQPQAFFYEGLFEELVDSLSLPESVRGKLRVEDGPSDYDAVLATEPRDVNIPLALNDVALYIHTGGTTATPKVCIVPHRQMVWNSFDILITAGGNMGQSRELLTFPFFHVGGWNTFTPLYHSGGHICLLRQFDPGLVLKLIAEEKITHFGAVEAMLRFMVDHPNFADTPLDTLDGVTTGGAPCAPTVMKPFFDRGVPVTQSYGLTEAGPSNFAHNGIDQPLSQIWDHNASIGTTFYHCDFKIIEQGTHKPVQRGERGVLCLRSAHNFQEYLHQPERTDKLFLEDGWVYSGDLAVEDEHGYVYIVGRADNMFISGGENVSPEEIENVIKEHPLVSSAAVVGIQDERWGQAPLAAVVLAPGAELGEDDVIAYCKAELASYKVPRKVLFLAELPLTGAGKTDRNAVKARYEAEQG
ncbi:class I adenylate-forming enzyme family protein [Alkalilimnicola sp. S0819]|uniref:class I adenylate-forming enzyme family protein n=1 Tax=Alkalilimnicola sp. S0819 TaxID=2613922 RepID=UPI0012617892|nr:class I adenylate-forming enzyme family protein [Alkalilimnicola sp. S0819]KAB7619501.1 acyl--CoA ligase [Alkalilimnicola sp. S0819]MPQ17679.1 AMP-binding protein [Alkalilimnicola sp. S0819]